METQIPWKSIQIVLLFVKSSRLCGDVSLFITSRTVLLQLKASLPQNNNIIHIVPRVEQATHGMKPIVRKLPNKLRD